MDQPQFPKLLTLDLPNAPLIIISQPLACVGRKKDITSATPASGQEAIS
ncbi:hypothetical protein CFII64_18398 [Pseudomonas sp. CFII64]|nr:hypothetical protein CFII64_18398 [Pseudomonas sp. CFII64]